MRLAVIMSMVGYVAMSSGRTGWDYNTVMYAVLFARVRLLPVCPSAGWWFLSCRADGITIPSPVRLVLLVGGYVFMSYGMGL